MPCGGGRVLRGVVGGQALSPSSRERLRFSGEALWPESTCVGRSTPLTTPVRDYLGVRLAPDGRRAAVWLRQENGYVLWQADLERGTLTLLEPGWYSVWAPNGKGPGLRTIRRGRLPSAWRRSGADGAAVEGGAPIRMYDVAPDGRSFLTPYTPELPALPAITHVSLVLNWGEELKARAPAGR